MPGFLVKNVKSKSILVDKFPERCISGIIGGGVAQRQTLDKFLHDKAFEETEQFIIIAEGYMLNKKDLFNKYGVSSISELISCMLKYSGESFFSEFRGCFSGAVYVKKENKWIIYTNQIGDNPVFYLFENGKFAAASQVNYLLDFCKEQGISFTFNESCAYQMLTYGYIATDETYAKEIKRLNGGNYLVFQNGKVEVKTYHRFEKHTERFEGQTEEQIIDEIDRVFRMSVSMEWGKDNEYGYRHLADLSGGLDSRMNLWIAHEMQKRHMTVISYSKKGYLDETVAKEITDYWNDEFIFMPLDDAVFMYDLKDNTNLLSGLSLYSGITGGKRILESLDLRDYGIEHTGMVGDAVLGSFFHHPDDGNKKWPTGMYSEKLKNRLPKHVKNLPYEYFDYEIFLMYVRGFHGACNTHLLRRNYTEIASPFLNVEFMQLCYDIPVALRIGHNIYKKWIIRKYPEAAKFKWEKTGGLITEKHSKTVIRKLIKRGPMKLMRIFGFDDRISEGMNPIDYWISNDARLKEFLDKSKEELIKKEKAYYSPLLVNDLSKLYDEGNASEKAMVLTVLAATELFFNN